MPSAPQMRSIKLTCEQRRVLLAMRELYLRNMGALVRRRQQLSAELQVTYSGPTSGLRRRARPMSCLDTESESRRQPSFVLTVRSSCSRVPAASNCACLTCLLRFGIANVTL